MKATWEDTVLAESDQTIVIEGNHYSSLFHQEGILSTKPKAHDLPVEGRGQLLSCSSRGPQ